MKTPKLIQPPKVELQLTRADGTLHTYTFSFYQATWTGGPEFPNPRYVAHTNAGSCYDIYAEGFGWSGAFTECLKELVAQGKIKG